MRGSKWLNTYVFLLLGAFNPSYAFNPNFYVAKVVHRRFPPSISSMFVAKDLADAPCNPFGDTVCPPAAQATGDLSPVKSAISDTVGKAAQRSSPGNVKLSSLDFSTLKPGPQANEGLEKLKSNFAGMASDAKGISISPPTPSSSALEGWAKLRANLQNGPDDVSSASTIPLPNFPPPPTSFSLLDIQAWMLSLDDTSKNWLLGGLLFVSFVALAGNKESSPSSVPVAASAAATATATASPPAPVPSPASTPAPSPAASTEAPIPAPPSASPSPAPAPASPPKPMGKPGDPQVTLNESRLKLMQLEQAQREAELQKIKDENDTMKKKLEAFQKPSPPKSEPAAKAPPKQRKKVAAKPKVDAAMLDTLKNIDGPNAQKAKLPPKPVAAPEDPLAAAKAAAVKVAQQSAAAPTEPAPTTAAASTNDDNDDEWSNLTDSALKRKTVAQLKAFITSKGDKPKAKAVKADLVKQVKGLIG